MVKLKYFFLFSLVLVCNVLFAQSILKGILVDSVHNNVLGSGTISIYEQNIETVEKVSLTDRFGRFEVLSLPANKIFKAVFSYNGFESKTITFQLFQNEKRDLGRISLQKRVIQLETIEVKAPVVMNGDTLEFNADAFKLDTNAVAEDLLHKLPGIVVWGDGKITYKGKPIPKVLVNGKDFFGSDKVIALQNIPKNAIDKLQVYDKRDEAEKAQNPFDNDYEMNIVLKDGKENMYFGTIASGVGTDRKYDGNLNLNYANKKLQSTLAYSRNNTNRSLTSINQLLRNTTFKGIGIMSDFDSDFSRSGHIAQNVLGGRVQYDFKKNEDKRIKNILSANYLIHWDKEIYEDKSITRLLAGQDDHINESSSSLALEQNRKSQHATVDYRFTKEIAQRKIVLRSNLDYNNQQRNDNSSSKSIYNYTNNKSEFTNAVSTHSDSKLMNIGLEMDISSKDPMSLFSSQDSRTNLVDQLAFTIKFTPEWKDEYLTKNAIGNYYNLIDSNKTKSSNRGYQEKLESKQQYVFFGVSLKNFQLTNELKNSEELVDRIVRDRIGQIDTTNYGLTYLSNLKKLSYIPSVNYSFNVMQRQLSGRESEYLTVRTELGLKLFKLANSSSIEALNIEKKYYTYQPNVTLNYKFSKLGKYEFSTGLAYKYDEYYPMIHQLVNVYDDINPSFRIFGNINLKQEQVNLLMLNAAFVQNRSHGYAIKFNTTIQGKTQGIMDSVAYVVDQQEIHYINSPRTVYEWNNNFEFEKSYLFKEGHTLAIKSLIGLNWYNGFQYVNDQFFKSLNNNQQLDIKLYYTINNRYSMSLLNDLNRYQRRNRDFNANNYLNKDWSVGMGFSYLFSKKISFKSELKSKYISSTFGNDDILLLNTFLNCRFSKGNNFEAKIAAYDLLNQNKGIYFKNGINEYTSGQRNNLAQYFMLTLTYFPRKFGF